MRAVKMPFDNVQLARKVNEPRGKQQGVNLKNAAEYYNSSAGGSY